MKRLIYLLLVLILFSVVFAGSQQQVQPTKAAVVVVKIRYTNVKELADFEKEIRKLAISKNINVDEVQYKSVNETIYKALK